MTTYEQIAITEVDRFIAQRKVLILDLREHLEYRCGHIANAVHVARDNIYTLLENMSKRLPVLFYGESKGQARKMAKLFSDFGFTQCFYLNGDYDAWSDYHSRASHFPQHLCSWLQINGYDREDINQRGFNGETPLMTAARSGQLEFLIELIVHGAELELVNDDGNSAVWLACYSNNIYVLMALIEAGANVNVQNVNGASALIYAASAGRLEMLRILLKAGANRGLVTHDGFSALDVASTLEILKLLRLAEKKEGLAVQQQQYLKAS